jgi:putative transposase
VGEPFNDAAEHAGAVQAQLMSQTCTRRVIGQLDYKSVGAIAVNEAYTSQTCPVCGERSKQKRIFRCPSCGAAGPRDAIGATNILCQGLHGTMLPGRIPPQEIRYLRPWRSSSGGHPARSSA